MRKGAEKVPRTDNSTALISLAGLADAAAFKKIQSNNLNKIIPAGFVTPRPAGISAVIYLKK